jgi:predicted kinase
MGYYIIIRGPAGVGKTTIAKGLAEKLGAYYISVDQILKENGLDVIEGKWIPERNFIRANEIALDDAVRVLEKGGMVVFDGNFYHRGQLEHLKVNLPYRHMVFTLEADPDECVRRDSQRAEGIGEKATRAVYGLVTGMQAGKRIETCGRTPEQTEDEIVSLLPEDVRKEASL